MKGGSDENSNSTLYFGMFEVIIIELLLAFVVSTLNQ